MIVGFDIDGTITMHTQFFSFLTHALVEGGHEVVIITTRDERGPTEQDLDEWSIAYTELVVADYADNPNLDEWKAKICSDKGIEIYFEDDADVLNLLDERIVKLKPF